jgi:hypothetical protein
LHAIEEVAAARAVVPGRRLANRCDRDRPARSCAPTIEAGLEIGGVSGPSPKPVSRTRHHRGPGARQVAGVPISGALTPRTTVPRTGPLELAAITSAS